MLFLFHFKFTLPFDGIKKGLDFATKPMRYRLIPPFNFGAICPEVLSVSPIKNAVSFGYGKRHFSVG